jgi:hypothetical protein
MGLKHGEMSQYPFSQALALYVTRLTSEIPGVAVTLYCSIL